MGLGQVIEAERRRRRAAVADTLALIAALNGLWSQPELESVIHIADEALYRAKREGRDRWAAAGVTSRV